MNINLLTVDELATLRQLIDNVECVALVCHTNADGDAIGSSLAWGEYLRQQGKKVTLVIPDMYPDYLQWLPGITNSLRFDKKPEDVKELLNTAELLCFLDLNCTHRANNNLQPELDAFQGKRILIDHHLDPQIDADLQVSHPEMSSTSEMIFRLIWQLGGYDAMTKDMAVSIYCGMMTDTGAFTFNSTKPEIFFIISQLLAKGIDKDKIYRNIYNVYSIDRLRLTGYVLYQKMKVMTPLRASYYTLSKEELKRFHFKKGDAEGLVNMPLQIKGHRLSISLREDTEKPDTIWLSLRSVDNFPCNEMAEKYFNGGGHKNAAGGKLFCTLKEAEEKVREAIKAYSNLL